MSEAEQQLRAHQQQLDADGIMVGVSRQALEEVLAELQALREEKAEQYQLAQYYRSVLQKIRDRTPANQHASWPHHHWYLATASNAINHKLLEVKGE